MSLFSQLEFRYAVHQLADMPPDDGAEVALKQGDILIQKGTWHGWENRSDTTCRLAFVLIDGVAPTKTLHPTLGH